MTQQTLTEWNDTQNESGTAGPPRCLSLTVRGPWGHFRRVEGNIVKQTYRIIPRTTVAGLLAAVLGIERDGYYELFARGRSAIAIEPVAPLRTVNMPVNTLSTADESMKSLNPRGKISIKLPDPTKPRQQHNYEVLVDPAYRLYVWMSDSHWFETLHETLDEGKSHYVPSLGLSEYLAEITYHGRFEVESGPTDTAVAVDSAVPNAVDHVVPDAESRCQIEESPAFMTVDGGGRTTTDFTSYTYNPDAGPVRVRNPDTAIVDGNTVMFV
ncbi:type I-B CRISPR-associated protein Cas5 (plasmid) [Haloferax mediterranei ATCC 33500]|uniref:CRISPR-associated Cas5h family protein n=1 Tax=Haloferax mediterranei (strain ATCC 33500 / DSM 1411 / JCM 8866 / NBRC 14739 / NCIMB 2177 / R-4) TaxID=523841 RepID=I3RB29_HALMT|nr:type I-B CRISPR-associated protein Cas5b [Haloferax mediterranei]AFK21439.1 CRISPR-associated Cas5h family protein [Haloferax mediterranei ATCC 33500]AHZ24492.1 CRISPR-associated protein Cas5 [Haloferax mediterranei ATCC 33500]ELZ97244.1 CRISPR-associated Cas5h family protein [Haloferax mediterranei ATCC 33500]MDX5990020.1 type I-B CRISPR-associated protein Cas5b [Haloferax mediterranei ATCC 33500]QCQ76890.1 type I-B CRISPR-associated protein Cas5 [Haloferax mediterranei ATCC 33500]